MSTHHHPHCPQCLNKETIKWGRQQGRKRYFCKQCNHSFSLNHRPRRPVVWIPYVDGVPLRKLGDEIGLSPAQTYAIAKKEMDSLPDNNGLSRQYCGNYCGILVLDGKFIKVRPYRKKIPFLYGLDYLTHDLPVGILALGESTRAYHQIFKLLKDSRYPLRAVVCDDVLLALKPALNCYYPEAKIQLCQNHHLENIRQKLKVRTSREHVKFFNNLKRHVFDEHRDLKQLKAVLHHFIAGSARKNVLRQQIVMDIWNKREHLFAYEQVPECPNNTNLIELFNSHLNARLKSVKGFKSLAGAQRFLNAWMIRRRTKVFTDCEGRFKYLNHKYSLQMTIKKQADLPELFRKYQLETER